jgi:hypothetical protein
MAIYEIGSCFWRSKSLIVRGKTGRNRCPSLVRIFQYLYQPDRAKGYRSYFIHTYLVCIMAGTDIPRWQWALADDYPFAQPPEVNQIYASLLHQQLT